ncbi:hypothetical protein MK079_03125 [Candidatus Gracilibacteria bacterium]|nr:hypothetical protein [Candidatus Gracilibacteria bacterium]
MTSQNFQITGSNFGFSGVTVDTLGASEYTLVTIAVDTTGSTHGFSNELRDCLISAVEACQKSPRSDNLLLRVIEFSTSCGNDGMKEIHGFTPLIDINTSDYPQFRPDGLTPLYDAVFSSVGAMIDYGETLMENDYLVNAIAFIITDGYDNRSTTTPKMIAEKLESVNQDEQLESLVSILIGVNAQGYQNELTEFRQQAKIDEYIDAGDASKSKLAKLANFVSQSVSSQSQALGTGGPSQEISATI